MKLEIPKDWFEKRLNTDEGEVGAGVPPKFNQGRELKFRVWYPKENKFYYTKVEDTYFHLGKDAWNEPYVIQQCTTCHDKDNKDIYEGDIISYSHNGNSRNGRVTFYAGIFFVDWYDQSDDELGYMTTLNIKLIGNIFETPELFK